MMVCIGIAMSESSPQELHKAVSEADSSSSVLNGGKGKFVVLPELDRPLPVVELKPFTRQVWRREKSYPAFYDKPQTADDENVPDRRLNFDNDSNEAINKKEAAANAILLSKFLDRQRVYTSEVRLTDTSGPRYRTKIHPSVDFSYNCRPQKSNGLIPEFIPRPERTKNTFHDATKDDGINRQYSLSKAAASDDMTTATEDIKIHGGRVTNTSGIPKFHLTYLNPLENYKKSDSWKNRKYVTKERHLMSSLSAEGSPPSGSGSGSHYHKSSAASDTSSVIGPFKYRGRVPMKQVHDTRLNKPLGNKHHVSVNIGGIKNALHVLSQSGPPTKVERQLTFEMEVNMEKCRRNLELMPPDSVSQFPSFNPSMFYDVNRAITLTKGEEKLKQGRDLNSRKQSRKHTRGRPMAAFEHQGKVRPAEALFMEADSPRIDTLESAFYHGMFDRMSDHSTMSAPHPNSLYQFSKGNPLSDIASKRVNANHTPSTDTSTIRAESLPRDLATSDIRLDEVKDTDQFSPRTSSIVSGTSQNYTTYITEPCNHPATRVMSIDSQLFRGRRSKDTSPTSFSKAHFKPCSNVKLKDEGVTSETGGIRAVT